MVSICFNGWFFLTSPRCWCPQQFLIPLCQGWELDQTWNLLLPAAPAGISEGHQQNSLSLVFDKLNIILPMQKLHPLILGFCSFRWFVSLILFLFYIFLVTIPENPGLAKAIQTQGMPLKAALVVTLYFHCWSSLCYLKVKDLFFPSCWNFRTSAGKSSLGPSERQNSAKFVLSSGHFHITFYFILLD